MPDGEGGYPLLANIRDGATKLWGRLNQRQRIVALGLAGVLVLALVVAVATVGGEPDYGPLFTGLPAADAALITEKLSERNIPFRIEDGGRVIMVPMKDVAAARLAMAAEGLPQGGVVGFEIFDQAKLGSTEFERRINYKRALEGELTRTLRQIEEVDDARVMIVMPEPSVFLQDAKPATASVWLRLKPFAQIDVNQVKGIVHLITHAVENLSPHDVRVIDVHGRELTAGIDWDEQSDGLAQLTSPGQTVAQMELQRKFQADLERGLQNLLEQVFGPGNAVARVSAELNFDHKVTESELFQPKPDGQGVIRSLYELERTVDGSAGPAGQVPGVEANVPGEPGGVPNYVAAQGGGDTRSEETERIVNYEVSRITDSITKAPGAPRRLSVGVVINSETLTPEQLEQVRNLVAAAIGLDASRNDQIEVTAMPFDTTVADSMRAVLEAEQATRQAIIRYTFIAVGLLALAAAGVYVLRQRRLAPPEPELPFPVTPVPVAAMGGAPVSTPLPEVDVPPTPPPEPMSVPEPEPNPAELRARQLQEDLQELAETKPEDVAALLKGWLAKHR